MLQSLKKHAPESKIFVLAMDEKTHKVVNENFSSICNSIFINELEKKYQDLKKCRLNRTLTEFYFTSKGYLCKYIFELHNHIDIITYIDSDLYFFSNPSSLFDELRGYSVGITKHNFHWSTIYFLKYGKYNAGWITFRKDENGLKCLNDWIRDCNNWCHAYVSGRKYGDQKYLDEWIRKYNGVKVINSKGANLAPWNLNKFKLSTQGKKIYVENDLLIFFHFSKLEWIELNKFKTNLSRVYVRISRIIKKRIYIPYLEKLQQNSHYSITSKTILNQKKRTNKSLFNIIRDKLFPDTIYITK